MSTHQNKKNIVILGAGFCGLQVAKKLAQKLKNQLDWRIVLIDRAENHVYHADLYEISTAYHPRITRSCLRTLKASVCIPIKKALKDLPVQFIQTEILTLDYPHKKITLKNHPDLEFEYLVIALGSTTNYYGIPGLPENSFPLKSLEDALNLNCQIEETLAARYEKKDHRPFHIVIGGGGVTGVEYACELAGWLKKLAKKYHFQLDEIHLKVVQGGSELIGIGQKVSDLTLARLQDLKIEVLINSKIISYKDKKLAVCSTEKKSAHSPKDESTDLCQKNFPADLLIWTGGIQPNPLSKNFPILHSSGALEVTSTLENPHYPKVYAGGDNAAVFASDQHHFLPKTAHYAIEEGKTIGHNIYASIVGKDPEKFAPHAYGYLIALGGKYFIYAKGKIIIKGRLPYFLKKLQDLRYFLNFLSFDKALKKVQKNESLFILND